MPKKKEAGEKKEKEVGKITHFYSNIGVAVVEISAPLSVGDEIHIKGVTTDFTQTIDSMQVEHETIKKATKGKVIGLKVADKVREGDVVYKVG